MTLAAIRDALTRVPEVELRRAVAMALEVKRRRGTVYFVGNGGSAAIASHMAADWLKTAGIAAQCFNDGALVTCLANDLGYEQAFSRPLSIHGRPNDMLFAISSSGKSASILEAVSIAKITDMRVVTLSGFSPDNLLREQGDVNFYVDSREYGVVEISHHAICHEILDMVTRDTAQDRERLW